MAKVIVMPKLGYTQDTGSIAAWLKNEGDTVERGEALFDAHTDKTVVTVESNCSGTVLKIALEPEIIVPVLTPVAVVGEPGEDAEAALANHKTLEVILCVTIYSNKMALKKSDMELLLAKDAKDA